MSAAVVAVALPCGCCPDMGRYCATGRMLRRIAVRWDEEYDLAVIRKDPDAVMEAIGKSGDGHKALRMHMAGRF